MGSLRELLLKSLMDRLFDFGSLELPSTGQAMQSQIPAKSSFISFERAALERSICDRFVRLANEHAHEIAVASEAESISYAALNIASNQIAHAILARTTRQVEPVVVMMEKGAAVIAVLLGILKAGKIYTPIDPSFPRARINYMLRDSQAGLIVCNHANLAIARECGEGLKLINIDEVGDSFLSDEPDVSVSPDSPVWILYTSGSTGQPKGVVQTHRNVLHYVMVYTNEMQICSDDRFSLLFSCVVNAGAHEIFAALLNGASIYPYTIQVDGITGIGKWLSKHRLTICSLVPTVFRHFVGTLNSSEDFHSLRFVKLIGEPVYKRDVDLFVNNFPDTCTFINRFGSSETGTIRWHFINHHTHIDGNNVPVGYSVMDNDVFLVDQSGTRVAKGEIGEIAVKSRYLSPGYWGKPKLTSKVFLPDPDGGQEPIYLSGDMGRMLQDDSLVCLGRKDTQIKIRGYRIEAGEIEKALLETGFIKDVIVTAVEQENNDQQLVAYVVFNPNGTPNISDLRTSLAITLPAYMIPVTFVVLDKLPLAPNGKVDRRALPTPYEARPQLDNQFTAPRSPLEREIAQIWSEILGLDKIGVRDNFIQLGGDSLKASRIATRVIDQWEIEITLADLLMEGTIEKMAEVVSKSLA